MKKMYYGILILVILGVGYYFVTKKAKKQATEGNEKGDTFLSDVTDTPPIVEIPKTATDVPKKYYDITDSEAKKAIDNRMKILHNNKWRDILSSYEMLDIFKGVMPNFKSYMVNVLASKEFGANFIKLGYSSQYFAKIKVLQGLRSIVGESRDTQLQKNAVNNLVVNQIDFSDVGSIDLRHGTDLADSLISSMGGDIWGFMEQYRVFGVNLEKASIEYKEKLQEMAISDLIKSGWYIYGYN